MASPYPPVVFVHGLWLHASSWQPWMDYFSKEGFDAMALDWPGEAGTIDETRQHPSRVANHGLEDITERHAAEIRKLPEKPILIGHSFGGLVVERLAGMGLSSATVAIDPAPMKGVFLIPFSTLRVASIALRNPANRKRAVSLTEEEFRYGFGNAISEEESKELYHKWAIPAPGKPLFEAAFANFLPNSSADVDIYNQQRGPMLIMGGCYDHTAPARISQTSYKLETKTSEVTDLHIFQDRGHSLTIDHGWPGVAEYIANWLKRHAKRV